MRFVIVCLINGTALDFHEKVTQDVCNSFKVKRQRLPAHFTLKAPFELDNISDLENKISTFVKSKEKQPVKINGLGHFGTNVIFMNIIFSKEASVLYNDFIALLKGLDYLTWKRHDGNSKTFHATIATHLKEDKFHKIWAYVSKYNPQFSIYFNNISILKWENDKWVTYKKFNF